MKKQENILVALIALGLVIIFSNLAFGNLNDLILIAYAVVGFIFFSTYALKIFTKADTFYVIALLKTKRLSGFIERISKPGIWDLLADIGLIIGFGGIAVDFLFARKKSTGKRILIDLLSITVLFAAFYGIFGFFFSTSPGMQPLVQLFSASFALGGLMLFAIISLLWNAVDIVLKLLAGKMPCPGVAPIIPGVQIPNVPSFLTPPLSVWGAFLIILAVHEFSHGALMKRTRLRIKSVGLALLGLLPIGAFVEPDEKQLKKVSERKQLRVYAIGPASNIYSLAAFLVIASIAAFALAPVLVPAIESNEKAILVESVVISGIKEDYEICGNSFEIPARGEIEEGWTLKEFAGIELNTFHDVKQAFANKDRNVSMVFEAENGSIIEKTLEKNNRGEIGIETRLEYVEGHEPTQEYLSLDAWLKGISVFFGWLLLLSFALALINFVPTEPFDGGKIAKIVFLPYFGFMGMNKKETQRLIGRLMLWLVAAILFFNAIPIFL
jgi:membrane-associated protease RseP (regulator of RpoE activity)